MCLVLLTCTGQRGNKDLSDDVRREITQGLQEGHGADKGIAIADSCCFYDFETCERVSLENSGVRLLAGVMMWRDVRCMRRLSSTSSPPAR